MKKTLTCILFALFSTTFVLAQETVTYQPAQYSDGPKGLVRRISENVNPDSRLLSQMDKEGIKEVSATIEALMKDIEPYETERVTKIREKITAALEKTISVDYDKNRLEQELIYYIEKLDINEEKQRLSNHLNYFRETMATGHGQGKKLGFIAQEMGREINTTGSKSNHAEMQNIVVRMKDELEQIKEQVLNVM